LADIKQDLHFKELSSLKEVLQQCYALKSLHTTESTCD